MTTAMPWAASDARRRPESARVMSFSSEVAGDARADVGSSVSGVEDDGKGWFHGEVL